MMEQVPHLLQWHALFDNVWDVELGEVDVLVQRRQLVNKRNLPTKFLADKRPQNGHDGAHEHGGMHNVQRLEVLLVLSIEAEVHFAQPAERRLGLSVKAVVKVNDRVVVLNNCIHGLDHVPEHLVMEASASWWEVARVKHKHGAAEAIHTGCAQHAIALNV